MVTRLRPQNPIAIVRNFCDSRCSNVHFHIICLIFAEQKLTPASNLLLVWRHQCQICLTFDFVKVMKIGAGNMACYFGLNGV